MRSTRLAPPALSVHVRAESSWLMVAVPRRSTVAEAEGLETPRRSPQMTRVVSRRCSRLVVEGTHRQTFAGRRTNMRPFYRTAHGRATGDLWGRQQGLALRLSSRVRPADNTKGYV